LLANDVVRNTRRVACAIADTATQTCGYAEVRKRWSEQPTPSNPAPSAARANSRGSTTADV
jgi:hypothetical protein